MREDNGLQELVLPDFILHYRRKKIIQSRTMTENSWKLVRSQKNSSEISCHMLALNQNWKDMLHGKISSREHVITNK